jgi:hypothetical protein
MTDQHYDDVVETLPDATDPSTLPGSEGTDPPDASTVPGSDATVPTGSESLLDLTDNGVPDAVVVEIAAGVPGLAPDIDEDGRPNAVALDTDGDGNFETQIASDGAGGFVVAVDTNGDGTPDSEQTISRSDLDTMFPGLADILTPSVATAPPTGTSSTAGSSATRARSRSIGSSRRPTASAPPPASRKSSPSTPGGTSRTSRPLSSSPTTSARGAWARTASEA